MATYSMFVTDSEVEKSPFPSQEEVVAMSQSLEILKDVGVPVLECISTVVEFTPNARLRQVLGDIYEVARSNDISLEHMLSRYPQFENTKLPRNYVSNQIGRSESLMLFTKNMARNLTEAISILRSLRLSVNGTSETFREEVEKLIDEVEAGSTIYEAMAKRHTIFDRMYQNMVKAGEMRGELLQSFEFLAQS